MTSPDCSPACPAVPADRDDARRGATDDTCAECAVTIALSGATRTTRVCSCGAEYVWRPQTTLDWLRLANEASEREASIVRDERHRALPSLTPGGRVYRAEAGVWTARRPPPPRVLDADPAELVEVRRLLCELRPDRAGPLGWGPDGHPPDGAVGSQLRPRVQCSPMTPTILPGAFAGVAPVTAGTRAAARIEEIRATDPAAAHTLAWLQRHGTLAHGLVALHGRVGLELADAAHRARWVAAPDARREGAVALGRKMVRRACLVWFGRVVSTTPEGT